MVPTVCEIISETYEKCVFRIKRFCSRCSRSWWYWSSHEVPVIHVRFELCRPVLGKLINSFSDSGDVSCGRAAVANLHRAQFAYQTAFRQDAAVIGFCSVLACRID